MAATTPSITWVGLIIEVEKGNTDGPNQRPKLSCIAGEKTEKDPPIIDGIVSAHSVQAPALSCYEDCSCYRGMLREST